MNVQRKDGGRRKRPRRALAGGTMEKLFGRRRPDTKDLLDLTRATYPVVLPEAEPEITVREASLRGIDGQRTRDAIKLVWEADGLTVVAETPRAIVEEYLRPLLLHALAGTLPEKRTIEDTTPPAGVKAGTANGGLTEDRA